MWAWRLNINPNPAPRVAKMKAEGAAPIRVASTKLESRTRASPAARLTMKNGATGISRSASR